ncbi:Inactive tyrosine-protein kinase 7 [Gossypium arboreum]|uniref:Inactive tyrosine-protein kinase 7 n=1 Tax=Gossypium arboreum TaxID=29729 RepID=A0A0B0PQE3_GOSAR|nr:Inactive tyrosine-protein kinase 7 [Gossypium arboreum]
MDDNLMADPDSESIFRSDALGLRHISSSLFNIPGFLVGFSAKGSSDSDAVRSPTSPLDLRVFANLSNPFSVKSPQSPSQNGYRKKWDCNKIDLGIVNLLADENKPNGEKLEFPKRKNIIFRPRMKTELPCSSRTIGINSSPQLVSKPSSLPTPLGHTSGSLSAHEIELSEDYTCIISHGPNPKTTRIFGDCILECHNDELTNFDKTAEQLPRFAKNTETLTAYPSDEFLSFCYSCKKKFEKDDDIYMYRGEKAFCSTDCRSEEIFAEEEMEKTCNKTSDDSPEHSDNEDLFVIGMPVNM